MSDASHLNVLVVDIGGTHVKVLATGQAQPQEFPSGPTMTPEHMVSEVKKLTADWKYDVVSIGYPGPVLRDRPVAEPYNLAAGWIGFQFGEAFGRRLKLINDAAIGDNANGFLGGFRLWEQTGDGILSLAQRPVLREEQETKGARTWEDR